MGAICSRRTVPLDYSASFSTILPTKTTEDKAYYYPYLHSLFACVSDPVAAASMALGATPSSPAAEDENTVLSSRHSPNNDRRRSPHSPSSNYAFSGSGGKQQSNSLPHAPGQNTCIAFIPKERCVTVLIGDLLSEKSWKWAAYSWRECMQYARLIWRKKYQLEDASDSIEMKKNHEQMRQQWTSFKSELEKCFWRKELRVNSEKTSVTLDFLELETQIVWEGFVKVPFDVARMEIMPQMYKSYREYWDYKVAMERKKDIVQKQREDFEHTRKRFRESKRKIKELEIENKVLRQKLGPAHHQLDSKRRASSISFGSDFGSASSVPPASPMLRVRVNSESEISGIPTDSTTPGSSRFSEEGFQDSPRLSVIVDNNNPIKPEGQDESEEENDR